METDMSNFYESIEPGVREIVYNLRNAGINTECSCDHGMWIQCQSLDQYTELSTIHSILIETGYKDYRVVITDNIIDGHRFTHLEIAFPDRNNQYYCRMEDNDECEFNKKEDLDEKVC